MPKGTKHVVVVGAGLSGLTAIKQLRDEGHRVTCLEKSDDLGGVFADGSTYDSVLLTVSNYFMAFSDFLPSDERLKFWTRKEYYAYLRRYVHHYRLDECIQFGTEVESIRRAEDGWRVVGRQDGDPCETVCDAVAICSGMFQQPYIPPTRGLEEFEGTVIHARDYRNAKPFTGQRVLCVGLGESSADITSEISMVAKDCLLSLRRYPAVAPRYAPFQSDPYFTIDSSIVTSRIVNYLPSQAHAGLVQKSIGRYRRSKNPDVRCRGDWDRKAGPPPRQVITKNERVFRHIVDRQVRPNFSGIDRLSAHHVHYRDGSREAIDSIVFCTGFRPTFPFLEVGLRDLRDLYRQMYHVELGPTVAFIGFARPQQGGVPAIAEMQARHFAAVCSERCGLPSREQQVERARRDRIHWEREYYITPDVTSLVNYCHYMDALAEIVGCMPDTRRPWLDPKLYLKLWFGPQFSAQYRLRGPHATPARARRFLCGFPTPASLREIVSLSAFRGYAESPLAARELRPRRL
ncbi:MAG: NAD(P)-binding domain-containing protein [Myxococcales bacterium]|nr:NAD(P)-binding domain-containing protein [Myxococcales bacterium]